MAVELGPLTRTKLFQQHMLATRDSVTDAWSVYEEGQTIDEQVREWVTATGSLVVGVSAPGYAMGWLDEEMRTRSILVGVVLIYRPSKEESDDHRKPISGPPDVRGIKFQ